MGFQSLFPSISCSVFLLQKVSPLEYPPTLFCQPCDSLVFVDLKILDSRFPIIQSLDLGRMGKSAQQCEIKPYMCSDLLTRNRFAHVAILFEEYFFLKN